MANAGQRGLDGTAAAGEGFRRWPHHRRRMFPVRPAAPKHVARDRRDEHGGLHVVQVRAALEASRTRPTVFASALRIAGWYSMLWFH